MKPIGRDYGGMLILAHRSLTRSYGPNTEGLDATQQSERAVTAISIESTLDRWLWRASRSTIPAGYPVEID
jgi:hypothetical protein